ncbi:MAG: ATP-binding cassette domain-containing protein [Actinobacteria bacterium]|nr:ATP-binding cassette domain-containing protein [Actinomycetota bacterium]
MPQLAISVSDLSKKYDSGFAVSHTNFEVPAGTICGFVGPNGAGKTTTIRMLLGLISPSGGTGRILGEPITSPEKYLSQVGAMIEGPAFYPALSGAENLKVLATLGGFPLERVDQLLAQVGLADRGKSKYKTYSLGMKQRLGIAAALLPNPKLLILDEPTNGLDPEGIQEIRQLLRSLADGGTTVFVLRKGEVVFAGAMQDLFDAQQPFMLVKTENKDDLEKIISLAEGAGHKAHIRDGVAHIEGPAEWAGVLNKLAFEAGILLTQLSPQLPNLEETFFEMTGDQK